MIPLFAISRLRFALLLGGLRLLCATGLQASPHAESSTVYRLGVFPYLSPTRIEQAYAQILP